MDKNRISVKKQVGNFQTLGPFLAFVFLFIFSAVSSDSFMTARNLSNVLRQCSINAMLAVGMTFVILTGGIDLSVGAVIAVAGAAAAMCSSVSPVLAICLPFAAGLLFGLLNGLLVTKVKMPAFIATLATMMAARGSAHLLIGSASVGVSRTSDAFMFISRGELFGVLPLPTVIMIVVFVAAGLFLKYSRYGRNIYAVGGNEEAAGMMGLKCDHVKVTAYMICGFTAALAGVILTSRLGTALPLAGTGYELKAISTVVLGGTYLTGGRGKMLGTFWAALTMGLLTNMFNMQGNLSTWTENILMGALLLGIVLLQSQVLREMAAKMNTKNQDHDAESVLRKEMIWRKRKI